MKNLKHLVSYDYTIASKFLSPEKMDIQWSKYPVEEITFKAFIRIRNLICISTTSSVPSQF